MWWQKSDPAKATKRLLRPWLDRKGFSIIGCFLAGALTLFLLELLVAARGQSLWSQEAAGWAQAIGTVAAIVFAWWQGHRSVHLEERRKRDEALRFLGSLNYLVESTAKAAEHASRVLAANDMGTFAQVAVSLRDKLKHFQKVAEIPVEAWPSAGLATDVDFCSEELEELFNGARDMIVKPSQGAVAVR